MKISHIGAKDCVTGSCHLVQTSPGSLKAKGHHPFNFKGLYAVQKYQAHQKLLNICGTAIIIACSGMCTGGRIVGHLKNGLEDRKTTYFQSDTNPREHQAER